MRAGTPLVRSVLGVPAAASLIAARYRGETQRIFA